MFYECSNPKSTTELAAIRVLTATNLTLDKLTDERAERWEEHLAELMRPTKFLWITFPGRSRPEAKLFVETDQMERLRWKLWYHEDFSVCKRLKALCEAAIKTSGSAASVNVDSDSYWVIREAFSR